MIPHFSSLLLYDLPNLQILSGVKVSKADRQTAIAYHRQGLWEGLNNSTAAVATATRFSRPPGYDHAAGSRGTLTVSRKFDATQRSAASVKWLEARLFLAPGASRKARNELIQVRSRPIAIPFVSRATPTDDQSAEVPFPY